MRYQYWNLAMTLYYDIPYPIPVILLTLLAPLVVAGAGFLAWPTAVAVSLLLGLSLAKLTGHVPGVGI